MPNSTSFVLAQYSFLISVPNGHYSNYCLVLCLGRDGQWLGMEAEPSFQGAATARGQRQPQEACVILACSVPVEKVHFQVFRAVVFYGTKFLWGKKI